MKPMSSRPREITSIDQYVGIQELAIAMQRLSPGTLFSEALLGLLNPETRTLGFTLPTQMRGAIPNAPLPLDQSLLLIWPQVTGLIAAMIVLFAAAYYLMVRNDPTSFSAHPLSRTDTLYFTITVFSTVGFGDITAKSQIARVAVMIQMALNIVLVGLGVYGLAAAGAVQKHAAARRNVQRRNVDAGRGLAAGQGRRPVAPGNRRRPAASDLPADSRLGCQQAP